MGVPTVLAPSGIRAILNGDGRRSIGRDRKSTRLNSSHSQISYAVFCLKKKKKEIVHPPISPSSTVSPPISARRSRLIDQSLSERSTQLADSHASHLPSHAAPLTA